MSLLLHATSTRRLLNSSFVERMSAHIDHRAISTQTFAVETMGGLRKTAQQLLREIHHAASSGCTWRDAGDIGSHLVDSIAIAVQRCNGRALQASVEMEARVAMGAA